MKCAFLMVIALAFSPAGLAMEPLYAQAHHPQFETVSNEIKIKFDDKQNRIRRELLSLHGDEWAGEYWAEQGPIDGALLVWSPLNGFTVDSGNSFHRGVERVNYGSVSFDGKLLTLLPERLEKDKHTHSISTSFVPVKWDRQRWLIPSDKVLLFIYAVNSGDYDEIRSFFLNKDDAQEPTEGLPNVPREYRKYLSLKPIKAKVTDVKANNDAFLGFTLTLNVGKSKGVIKGMNFYLVKVNNALARVKITEVFENKSEAKIVSIGSSGDNDKEIKPEVGWQFTSKQPQPY